MPRVPVPPPTPVAPETKQKMIGKPFEKGNSGRPKGATNKTTRLVKQVFADVFTKLQSHPTASLLTWGKKNPGEFYRLASKLIPIQVAGDPDNPLPVSNSVDWQKVPTGVLEALLEARIKPADESDDSED